MSILVAEPIFSITPFTLLDYPGKTACIIWFAGCNMECLYCYNPDIVNGKGRLSYEDALKFLRTRKGLLDGVVLSGGECTMHKGLEHFIREIRELGMMVKMDTNGSNTALISKLVRAEQLDYIALDFKAPADKFRKITRSGLFNRFEKTLDLLINNRSAMTFEVRSTIHSGLLDKEAMNEMIDYLEDKGYKGIYYLQNFLNDTETLGKVGNPLKKIMQPDIAAHTIKVLIRN
jgi:pyruvate formate lyase activating enzyme